MGLSSSTFRDLEKIVGKKYLSVQREELFCHSYDATLGTSFLPDAVIFPENQEQIAQIFKLACQKKIIIIPRGSGSGMTGGSIPVKGGVVMVTSRMNKILEIDEENFIARVEPGVVVANLHSACEARGLFYPPDPASSAVCTIGGNVGECAGGPRAVKYGVTRDYVLGLTAVMPSGDIIKTGVATAKGVAGYDLTRLIVGSEGTLAVVTQIILKLLPKPRAVKTLAVSFDSMDTAAKTVSSVMKLSIIPRCVEYLDEASINLVRGLLSFELPKTTRALLILELDGDEDQVEREAEQIKAFCKGTGAIEVLVATDQAGAQKIVGARRSLSPVLYKIAPNKINEDIVVPISKIPEMVEIIQKIQQESGLTVVSFGHAGDGNIHCNIMYDRKDTEQTKRAEQAVDDLFAATLSLGGTITGEHGVGITKMKYLTREIGSLELEIMKGIKRVFDPDHLLNPGKIFF